MSYFEAWGYKKHFRAFWHATAVIQYTYSILNHNISEINCVSRQNFKNIHLVLGIFYLV